MRGVRPATGTGTGAGAGAGAAGGGGEGGGAVAFTVRSWNPVASILRSESGGWLLTLSRSGSFSAASTCAKPLAAAA